MRRWFAGLVLVLLVLTTMPVPVSADMNLPEYDTGDQWVYSANLKLEDLATLSGEWTHEVQGKIQASGHEVYEVSLTGSGTATIQNIGILPYTFDGFIHLRVSDLARVKESMEIEFDTSILGFGAYMSVFVNMTYSPPVNDYDFPIKEGDTWSSSTSTTISINLVSSFFPSNETSVIVPVTTQYEVESKETVEVTAGKFATYVIKGTQDNGNTTYTYMSTKSGYMVKSRMYNETGVSVGTMNLKSYSYTAPGGNGDGLSDILDLWLLMVILIVIIVLVIAMLLRSRKRKGEELSLTETILDEGDEPPPV